MTKTRYLTPSPEITHINKTLENAPPVSFDVSMGKDHEYVDVDYEELSREMHRLGIRPDDRSEIKIRVKDKSIGIVRGSYSAIKNEVTVNHRSGRNINQVLSHELQHAADDMNEVSPEFDKRYITGNLGALAVGASLVVVIGGAAFGLLTNNPEVTKSVWIASSSVGLAGAIAEKYGRHEHPAEIRARMADESSVHESIVIQRKEDSI